MNELEPTQTKPEAGQTLAPTACSAEMREIADRLKSEVLPSLYPKLLDCHVEEINTLRECLNAALIELMNINSSDQSRASMAAHIAKTLKNKPEHRDENRQLLGTAYGDQLNICRQHWNQLSPHIKDRTTAKHLIAAVQIGEKLLVNSNQLEQECRKYRKARSSAPEGSTTGVDVTQDLVDEIIRRAEASNFGLSEREASVDISQHAQPDMDALAMLLVRGWTEKYDLVSVFSAALEVINEKAQNVRMSGGQQ